jgi:hypothetical protein
MSLSDPIIDMEPLYARFNELRHFPRERIGWIGWLLSLHNALRIALDQGDLSDEADQDMRADAAGAVTDLLYHDARGSSPWGGSTPAPLRAGADAEPSYMRLTREHAEREGRAVAALELLAGVWERFAAAADAVRDVAHKADGAFGSPEFLAGLREAMASGGDALRRGVSPSRTPTSKLLELAGHLVEDLEQLEKRLAVFDPKEAVRHKAEGTTAYARELLRQLRQDTSDAELYPTNELFEVLRGLPETERAALRTFSGISSLTISALQKFWASEP